MTPNTRRTVLLGLLAVSTALVAFGNKSEGEPSGRILAASPGPGQPARHRQEGSHPAGGKSSDESRATAMIKAIQPRAASPAMGSAFAVHDWAPPPRSLSVSPAPVAAPPLPFTFLGKMRDDGVWRVFLGREDKTYIVGQSDLIEGAYRVETVRPPVMIITYLPLREQQTLAIGDDP